MITHTQPGLVVFTARNHVLVYRNPVHTLVAHTPGEVVGCLRRIDELVADGLHAAGYLAYEAAPAFDPALAAHTPGSLPVLWFGLYRQPEQLPIAPDGTYDVGPWRPRVDRAAYGAAIEGIRAYIAAGDTYQVNYTFPLDADFRGDPLAWYVRLVEAQRADYCAYVDLGPACILSASPELFFRLDGDRLETRPMKGTRPRGRWTAEDRHIAASLAVDEKDRAENVMIVDLLRNDLGRISEVGSVNVDRLFSVERYETVFQMTSTIAARSRASVPEILAALFPSGSVTGAPKPRTMAIIRELEPHPRGVYCGAMGWWAPGRRACFNVAIRTVTVDTSAGRAECHVGGGITWGSTTQGEYDECRAKTAFLTFRRPSFQLLESIRFEGHYFLLDEHLARLRDSADYFGFALDLAAIRQALEERRDRLVAVPGPRKVRLLLDRDGTFTIEDEPANPASRLRVGFAPQPVDDSDVFLFHKTTHRDVYRRALASRPDCDDVLLVNTRGEVTVSTVANVVVRLDDRLLTPPVHCGLLAGTLRAHVLAEGTVMEAVLTRDDIVRAVEIWLINSVRGWIPVELRDRPDGARNR